MIITENTTFQPGEYDFSSGQGLIIAADGITLDGNGAILKGRGKRGNKYSYRGIGVYASGVDGVTVKGLTVTGFQLGMKVLHGRDWTIVNNDFSENYDDPDFGWGDGEPLGALMLEHVHRSVIRNNRGVNVWNGLNLVESDGNRISGNTFSHCSNVCLKLWKSSRNVVEDNVMSHGIRISPGEVHARDSTSVLIESGSNDNRFLRNDFTYGGDGVFIRSLNGIVSTGNVFEENDASYAHNNAWEVWDPGNVFIRNKGNHSSYGFWLGGSCHAVLIENEAAYNGRRRANAPESFGNAGIAVVNGSSSHFIMKRNHIHHNKSVGLAIRYKEEMKAYHWIIQQNVITDNETYGIYIKHAHWLDLSGNQFERNGSGDVRTDGDVSGLHERQSTLGEREPICRSRVSTLVAAQGEAIEFDASSSEDPDGQPLVYRWELGDGTVQDSARFRHAYERPGFYRVGLTVHNGKLADLAWHDVYILHQSETIGADPDRWSVSTPDRDALLRLSADDRHKLTPSNSIRIDSTARLAFAELAVPESAPRARQVRSLRFWVKFEHEVRDGFTAANLKVRLMQDDNRYYECLPRGAWLNWTRLPSEARYGWSLFEIVLDADAQEQAGWQVRAVGNPQPDQLRSIRFCFDSIGGKYRIWLDGISIA
jgi:parallel beta-helix repeat protein